MGTWSGVGPDFACWVDRNGIWRREERAEYMLRGGEALFLGDYMRAPQPSVGQSMDAVLASL